MAFKIINFLVCVIILSCALSIVASADSGAEGCGESCWKNNSTYAQEYGEAYFEKCPEEEAEDECFAWEDDWCETENPDCGSCEIAESADLYCDLPYEGEEENEWCEERLDSEEKECYEYTEEVCVETWEEEFVCEDPDIESTEGFDIQDECREDYIREEIDACEQQNNAPEFEDLEDSAEREHLEKEFGCEETVCEDEECKSSEEECYDEEDERPEPEEDADWKETDCEYGEDESFSDEECNVDQECGLIDDEVDECGENWEYECEDGQPDDMEADEEEEEECETEPEGEDICSEDVSEEDLYEDEDCGKEEDSEEYYEDECEEDDIDEECPEDEDGDSVDEEDGDEDIDEDADEEMEEIDEDDSEDRIEPERISGRGSSRDEEDENVRIIPRLEDLNISIESPAPRSEENDVELTAHIEGIEEDQYRHFRFYWNITKDGSSYLEKEGNDINVYLENGTYDIRLTVVSKDKSRSVEQVTVIGTVEAVSEENITPEITEPEESGHIDSGWRKIFDWDWWKEKCFLLCYDGFKFTGVSWVDFPEDTERRGTMNSSADIPIYAG